MSVSMPDRVPLEMPPNSAGALEELVREVAGAARCLAEVDDRLIGAGATAPGWLGDDAAAAAAQIATVAALVRAASEAAVPVAGRLSRHADLVLVTRRQIESLRDEQDQQFQHAYQRWYALPDLQAQIMTGGPDVGSIVAELEAGEARRRSRHSALLEDLADDAAATARVLTDACAVVGGHGRPGEPNDVVAYLAGQLPGWGDHELARQGQALAADLINDRSAGRRNRDAEAALVFAGSSAFAEAIFRTLGQVWMRDVLEALGDGDYDPSSALPQLVALTLGAAARGGGTGRAADVANAEYASADDPEARTDLAVLGMGTVLAASRALGARGMEPMTVSAWGRQIALREKVLGAAAIDRVHPMGAASPPVDALPVAVAILASAVNPTAGGEFLTAPAVWEVLLRRTWEDCGVSLRQVVASAGTAEGPVGEAVVRSGLESLAAHLEDANADDWPVHRATANAVSGALAEGLAAHASIAGTALMSGADIGLGTDDAAMLRGLGYVTLDRHAAALVEAGLGEWIRAQPEPVWVSGPPPLLPGIVVPNSYLAVREYGQKLAYALGELDAQREAADRAFLFNMTLGLAADLLPGPWGVAGGIVLDYVAMGLHLDGTWEPAADTGPHFAPDVPDVSTLTALSPEEWTAVDRMARMAEASYASTLELLAPPVAPKPDVPTWWKPLLEALQIGPTDALDVVERRHPPVSPVSDLSSIFGYAK